MTLGQRIKQQRQRCGLSQEKVAELVGVSRQAVTKWESGQSAPSTDNLFRLAELFDTSVDLLLADGEGDAQSVEERAYALFQAMEAQRQAERQRQRRRNALAALAVAAGYLLLFLVGLLLWSDGQNTTFLGWLAMSCPKGEHSYLFGWLLHKHLLWYAMILAALTALWGKRGFAVTTLAGFIVGLLAGVIFGPNPAGAAYGQSHYGWAIWAVIYLVGIVAGILMEKRTRSKSCA